MLLLNLDNENLWPELLEREVIHLAKNHPPVQLAFISSDNPTVVIRIDLPDHRVVLLETSARLFAAAGAAIQKRMDEQ